MHIYVLVKVSLTSQQGLKFVCACIHRECIRVSSSRTSINIKGPVIYVCRVSNPVAEEISKHQLGEVGGSMGECTQTKTSDED